jgi:hypothetical protein
LGKNAEFEKLERMHCRSYFVTPLFLGSTTPVFTLNCPSRVGGDPPQRFRCLLEQICVVPVDAGKLSRQRSLCLGAMAVNLRPERSFQIAEHEPNDVVGRSRRNG